MSWGDRFTQLYNDASEAAQRAAQATLSSAKAAATAVANAASKAGEAVADGAQVAAKAASNAATAAAQAAATAARTTAKAVKAGAQATAEAAVSASKAVAGAAVTTGKAVADGAASGVRGAGEVVNLGGSVVVIARAYTYSAAAYPYRQAAKLFSPSKTPEKTVVVQCPFAKVDTFNNEYRKKLVGSEFAGANSPAMRQAMEELSKDKPANVDENLRTIAKERNRPVEQIAQEYEAYRKNRATVLKKIALSNGKLEPIDELLPEQNEFMGSNWQLRYGKVVGDNLGIDPVFGAMLNPTGGMVGPGNKGKPPDAWYMPTPVAYHGAYHDAAGYLYNYQTIDGEKVGTGYNYMQSPLGLSTDNPLAGQGTGVAQWALNTR